jgi:hypothetical protein
VMVEGMLIDAKKLENMCHPIYVQDHYLDKIHKWLRYYGGLLLACEESEKTSEIPGDAFPQNFSGCNSYHHYYMPGWACDYSTLCRTEDWRNLASMYTVKEEEHRFVNLSVKREQQ